MSINGIFLNWHSHTSIIPLQNHIALELKVPSQPKYLFDRGK